MCGCVCCLVLCVFSLSVVCRQLNVCLEWVLQAQSAGRNGGLSSPFSLASQEGLGDAAHQGLDDLGSVGRLSTVLLPCSSSPPVVRPSASDDATATFWLRLDCCCCARRRLLPTVPIHFHWASLCLSVRPNDSFIVIIIIIIVVVAAAAAVVSCKPSRSIVGRRRTPSYTSEHHLAPHPDIGSCAATVPQRTHTDPYAYT